MDSDKILEANLGKPSSLKRVDPASPATQPSPGQPNAAPGSGAPAADPQVAPLRLRAGQKKPEEGVLAYYGQSQLPVYSKAMLKVIHQAEQAGVAAKYTQEQKAYDEFCAKYDRDHPFNLNLGPHKANKEAEYKRLGLDHRDIELATLREAQSTEDAEQKRMKADLKIDERTGVEKFGGKVINGAVRTGVGRIPFGGGILGGALGGGE
jgi:hypothetical protein